MDEETYDSLYPIIEYGRAQASVSLSNIQYVFIVASKTTLTNSLLCCTACYLLQLFPIVL